MCEGTGRVSSLDLDRIVDRTRSLDDGAILAPGFGPGTWGWRMYAESEQIDPAKRLCDYDDAEWHWLVEQEATKVKIAGINMTYEGLLPRIRRTFLSKERPPKQAHVKAYVEQIATFTTCPACGGTRLTEAPRTAKVAGITIADAAVMQVSDLLAWSLPWPRSSPGCASCSRAWWRSGSAT